MRSVALTLICLVLFGVQIAKAQSSRLSLIVKGGLIVEEEPAVDFGIRRVTPHAHTHPSSVPAPVRLNRPSFSIPKGKYGIGLNDGTKVIGIPKATSVTLKTSFGNVTIPRDKISKIESVKNEIRVHLVNGDRVSGKWVTTVMQFDTQFGTLAIPVSSLVWLRTSNASVSVGGTVPASTKPISGPRPPSGIPAGPFDSRKSPGRPFGRGPGR